MRRRGEQLLCRLRIGERAPSVSAGDANFGRNEQRCRQEPGKFQLSGRAHGFLDKGHRLFRRAGNRLGERERLLGLERCVLVVGFSQFERRRCSRPGFHTVAEAERHLRADDIHVCELGLESRFGPGGDGIGFVESGLGFVVPP